MPDRKFKLAKMLAIAGGVIVFGLLAFALMESTTPVPRPPLPNPNGYDDLIAAARMVVAHSEPLQSLSREELRDYVTRNAAAIRLARQGLTRKCRVPIEFSSSYLTNQLGTDLVKLKGLALTFSAEARLATMEGRTNDAANIHFDVIRLAHESVRGGLMIHGLVGLACEAIGMVPLRSLVRDLSAVQCRELARQLEAVDVAADTAGQFLAQEKAWSRHAFGLKEKLAELVMARSLKPARQKFEQKMVTAQTQRRLLLLDLAVRTCELEKGQRPQQLKELVPEYLKAIPIDPNTGTNLTYLP